MRNLIIPILLLTFVFGCEKTTETPLAEPAAPVPEERIKLVHQKLIDKTYWVTIVSVDSIEYIISNKPIIKKP